MTVALSARNKLCFVDGSLANQQQLLQTSDYGIGVMIW